MRNLFNGKRGDDGSNGPPAWTTGPGKKPRWRFLRTCLPVVVALSVSLLSLACKPETGELFLGEDELCELYINGEFHEMLDLWAKRYGVNTLCLSPSADTEGEVVVTVAVANREDELTPDQRKEIENMASSLLEALVSRQGWSARYPKRTVQVL